MTALDVLREAMKEALSSEDGEPIQLELLPPLSSTDMEAFERRLPCPLPNEIRDLLSFCRGFEGGAADVVDFTGERCAFELDAVFPYGLPIAGDGYGNFWVVDLLPGSTCWGPIYFASHDPPVILNQGPSLDDFLEQLLNCNRPPYRSSINDVHDDRLFNVWGENPGVRSLAEFTSSPDEQLRAFAASLDDSFQIVDMRKAPVGFGFSWGRYGPNTVVRRCGTLPIFAYQKPRSLFRKWFS